VGLGDDWRSARTRCTSCSLRTYGDGGRVGGVGEGWY
jgi:hypothetical protein